MLEQLANLPWRFYPASVLMVLGALFALRGLRVAFIGFSRSDRDRWKVLTIVRGFRFTVIGLAAIRLGVAWTWHLTWLFVLSLVIGGEEALEPSTVIYALRRERRLEDE